VPYIKHSLANSLSREEQKMFQNYYQSTASEHYPISANHFQFQHLQPIESRHSLKRKSDNDNASGNEQPYLKKHRVNNPNSQQYAHYQQNREMPKMKDKPSLLDILNMEDCSSFMNDGGDSAPTQGAKHDQALTNIVDHSYRYAQPFNNSNTLYANYHHY
jgi:hypothetical protein